MIFRKSHDSKTVEESLVQSKNVNTQIWGSRQTIRSVNSDFRDTKKLKQHKQWYLITLNKVKGTNKKVKEKYLEHELQSNQLYRI